MFKKNKNNLILYKIFVYKIFVNFVQNIREKIKKKNVYKMF